MSELLALHRYYIWANRLREHFDDTVSNPPLSAGPETIFLDDRGLFLSYWYAALYVVVEGWQQLQLSDPEVDALLSSPSLDLLRRFRNGVCHYQRNYDDPRFLDLIQAQGVVPWVRQLNLVLGRYFLQKLGQTKGSAA